MSGQKGPLYKQAGIAIPSRNPFNANIPNKRQTINSGRASLASGTASAFLPSAVIPFLQAPSTESLELFLFSEDVPTQFSLTFTRQSDWQKVTVSGTDYPFNVPTMCLNQDAQLNATPTLIDGYTAITATNGIAYGQIATGTTETNGVKVRGFAVSSSAPIVYEATNRYTGSTLSTAVTAWDNVSAEFTTRAANVNGYPTYNGGALTPPKLIVPVILKESDYTQAIQDAGNRIDFVTGVGSAIIVGIYKYVA